jgi:hypothetical protein
MVSYMGQSQEPRQPQPQKRKVVLSPEVSEFLHMLKALETELSSKESPAR